MENTKKSRGLLPLTMAAMTLVAPLMATDAYAADGEILIGAPISVTGPMAGDGAEQLWAYEQAIADANAEGGLLINGERVPVRLIVADDESAAGKVTSAMENLIKAQNVDVLLSTHSGPMNLAGSIVAEKYKKFYMITTAFPFEWQPYNFQHSALFFFHPGPGSEVPFQIWETLPEDQRPKHPALVVEDTPDGAGFGAGFLEAAKKYGYEYTVNDPWSVGSTDYSALITKLQATDTDAMFVFGSPADTITLVRQMKELGFSVPYFHGWKGTWTGEFADTLGEDSNYILTDGFWSASYPYPGSHELGERFEAEFGKDSVTVGAFYANAQVLLQAIETAGSTESADISAAIRGNTFENTVVGPLDFDDTGFALIPSVATQWWDGRHQLLFPTPDWEYRPAPAWEDR